MALSFPRSTKPSWPGGKQCAAALAFDLDGPTGDAMLDGSLSRNLRYFTEGAYGTWRALPRLVPRAVDQLADHRCPPSPDQVGLV